MGTLYVDSGTSFLANHSYLVPQRSVEPSSAVPNYTLHFLSIWYFYLPNFLHPSQLNLIQVSHFSMCKMTAHIRSVRAAKSTVSPYQSKETLHTYLLHLLLYCQQTFKNLYRLAVLPSFIDIRTRTGLHWGLCVSMFGCPGGFWEISCNLEIALRGIGTKGICMQHTKGRGVGMFVSVGGIGLSSLMWRVNFSAQYQSLCSSHFPVHCNLHPFQRWRETGRGYEVTETSGTVYCECLCAQQKGLFHFLGNLTNAYRFYPQIKIINARKAYF